MHVEPESLLIRGTADGVSCYLKEVFEAPGKEGELPELAETIPFMTHAQVVEWVVKRGVPFGMDDIGVDVEGCPLVRVTAKTVDGDLVLFDVSTIAKDVGKALPDLPVPRPEYKSNFIYLPSRYKDRPKEGWTFFQGHGLRIEPDGKPPETPEEVTELVHCRFQFEFENKYLGAFAEFMNGLLSDLVSGRAMTMPGIKI